MLIHKDGKFIEVPDQQMGQPQGQQLGGMNTSNTGMDQSGGYDMNSLLTKAIQSQAMKDPNALKNASKYGSLLNVINYGQPTQAEMASQKKTAEEKKLLEAEKKDKLNKIDQAIALLEGTTKTGKKQKTGFIKGRTKKLKSDLNMATDEEVEIIRLIGELGGKEMFEMGGKTLPVTERGILTSFLPYLTSGSKANIGNLKDLREKVNRMYSNPLYVDATKQQQAVGGGGILSDMNKYFTDEVEEQ